jgi:glutathione S-transferase
VKLYFFPVAPNPTKVRLYVAEKRAAGTDIELCDEMVDLRTGAQKGSQHLARNPFGRLPVLELDDGTFITESLAIIEYLEELYPRPAMIGETALERARVRELERIAEMGVLLPLARIIHATNSPLGWPPVPEVAALFRRQLPEACSVLEARLSDGRAFLAGERATIADCTLAAGLQFGRFAGVTLEERFANLAAWDRRYRSRAAIAGVLTA